MTLNSARIGFVEAGARRGAKQAAEMKINDQGRTSTLKMTNNKKSPTLLQILARKISGMNMSNNTDENEPDKAGAEHDSENARIIYTPSAKDRQRIQEWVYDVKDLLAALDPYEAGDADGDSATVSADSDITVILSMDDTPPNQEQERQTKGEIHSVEHATRGQLQDDTDSIATTLAEEDQPMRELLRQWFIAHEMLMLPGLP